MAANEPPLTYRQAGVDIDAGDELVERIKPHVRRTFRPEVIGDLGGFGGLFAMPKGYRDPILVSGTDGVGTKLKVAFATGRHDTIGIDLVAMNVNDVAVSGAEPLFFLDYFATGKLDVAVAEAVVAGIAEGCRQAGCALIGGETAEMPGLYAPGEYDLAGFAVGVVERDQLLDGKRVAVGDVVLGVAASGLHSNGYSLARRLLSIESDADLLLTPTRIYVRALRAALAAGGVKAAAHITGGGLIENPPRVLGAGQLLRFHEGSWPELPVFAKLAAAGVPRDELRRTFNCGLGLLVIVAPGDVAAVTAALTGAGEKAYRVGEIVAGSGAARVEFV